MPRRSSERKQPKGRRHCAAQSLPEAARHNAEALVAAAEAAQGPDAPLLQQAAAGARELLGGSGEAQSRAVASWAGRVIAPAQELVAACSSIAAGGDGGPWGALLRLLVCFPIHSPLAHLKKAGGQAVAAVCARDGGGQSAAERAIRRAFEGEAARWAAEAWRLLGAPGEEPPAAADARQALAEGVVRVAADADCMMDCLLSSGPAASGSPSGGGCPALAEALEAFYGQLLPVMARAMQLAVGWAEADGEAAATGACVDDLRYVMRIAVYVVQRFRACTDRAMEDARRLPQGSAPVPFGPPDCHSGAALMCICREADALLQAADSVPRDCHNQAGIAAALMLQGALPADPAAAAEWLWQACGAEEGGAADAGGEPALLAASVLVRGAESARRWLAALPLMGRAAVLRGVANCVGTDTLLRRVEPGGHCFLLHGALPFALTLCVGSDPQQRFIGLQTVELLLRKLAEGGRRRAPDPDPDGGDGVDGDGAEASGGPALEYDGALREALDNVFGALWECWEDTSSAVGHMLRDIFELCLSIHNMALGAHARAGTAPTAPQGPVDVGQLCDRLLAAHWHRRGKYAALLAMMPHVGALELRRRCPGMGHSVCSVMRSKALAHTAGAFYSAYALELAHELAAGDWDEEILAPAAAALLAPQDSRVAESEEGLLRDGVTMYGLLPMFNADASIAPRMLDCLATAARGSAAAGGVTVGLTRRFIAAHTQIMRLAKLHKRAPGDPVVLAGVVCAKAVVRMQALELLTLARRANELPAPGECAVVEAFVVRNLKTADQSLRSAHTHFVHRWLQRCRDALHRHYTDAARGTPEPDAEGATPEGTEQHLLRLTTHLVRSSYAGSPLERRVAALDLLRHVVSSFRAAARAEGTAPAARRSFEAVERAGLPPQFIAVQLGSLSESWDRVRAAAWQLLRLAPAPLPGYESEGAVQALGRCAAADIGSAKIQTADAGALVWRLVHRKYGVELGWRAELTPGGEAEVSAAGGAGGGWAQQLRGLRSLTALLRARHKAAPASFAAVHGIVAALRQVVADAELQRLAAKGPEGVRTAEGVDAEGWRQALAAAAELSSRVCSDAMRIVACVARGTDHGEDSDGEQQPIGVDCRGHAFYADRNDDAGDRLVVVNAWLAVKESTALLADIVTAAPLAEPGHPAELFPAAAVAAAGELLIGMALASKHNGAIAKASEALHRISHRCLRSPLAELRALPGRLLERLLRDGGVRSRDGTRALRRSGGLPYALLALLEAEDHDAAPPALANRALASLLEVAEAGRPEGEEGLVPVSFAEVEKGGPRRRPARPRQQGAGQSAGGGRGGAPRR
eukprot:TRINITY_DN41121_c0_g1_i2.p1 TRINITY_DN41121_c0_g1~~TRINITY_DN41121_c0_g1_i2.p1  ORF type:complete len:1325 (+),score=413.57 TRINITY_DN41121_c0_g1_i2:95-4069(+)